MTTLPFHLQSNEGKYIMYLLHTLLHEYNYVYTYSNVDI